MARALEILSRIIDAVNDAVGRVVLWLAVAMVVVQFAIVVLRYVFGVSIIMMQESMIYMHAGLFLLAAGYTLLKNGHVRVDVFYGEASPRKKAMIDLFGVLVFLIPVTVTILLVSWNFVAASWAVREGPLFVGGFRAVYLLKTLIPAFAVLVLLQGVALAARSVLVLAGVRSGRPEDRTEEPLF